MNQFWRVSVLNMGRTSLLRGRESNARLEVMSLPRYLSSTPLVSNIAHKSIRSNLNYFELTKDRFVTRDGATRE